MAFGEWRLNDHGNLAPIFLPKKYLDIKTKKLIPYKEILNEKIIKLKNNEELLKQGIKILDNSDDELLEASKEMISITDSEKKIIKVEQIEFCKVYNSLYNTEYPEMIISKNFYKNNKNLF